MKVCSFFFPLNKISALLLFWGWRGRLRVEILFRRDLSEMISEDSENISTFFSYLFFSVAHVGPGL